MNQIKMNSITRALLLAAGTVAAALQIGCGAAPDEEPEDVEEVAQQESEALASSQAPDGTQDATGSDPSVIPYACDPTEEYSCQGSCGARNRCYVCCPNHLNCVTDCSTGTMCSCESW